MAINKRIIRSNDEGGAGLSFNTVLYAGNNITNPITGVGFEPDLVWVKNRGLIRDHFLTNSVSGAGAYLVSNLADAEDTSGRFNSFDSDGFTVSTDSTLLNNSSYNYVAWCWKAGGYANTFNVLENGSTTSSATSGGAGITAGSITTGWSVSANRDAGFSIVKYNLSSPSTSDTIGHGLGVAPEMIITKCTSSTGNWSTYHKDVGTGKYLILNTTAAAATYANGFATVDATAWQEYFRSDPQSYIAYCFHSVAGFSKFGSYSGSGGAGNKQTMDFEPAFVMIKAYSSTGSWFMFDNKRSGDKRLAANLSNAESDETNHGINFLSDGFDFDAADANNSGINWIYMAFANQF